MSHQQHGIFGMRVQYVVAVPSMPTHALMDCGEQVRDEGIVD
jgi:hypothetical protein